MPSPNALVRSMFGGGQMINCFVGSDLSGDAVLYVQIMDLATGKHQRYATESELKRLAEALNEVSASRAPKSIAQLAALASVGK